MIRTRVPVWRISCVTFVTAISVLAAAPVLAEGKPARYEGKAVRIGQGSAHVVVRTDATGQPASVGVVFTPGVLDGLPKAAAGAHPDFPYVLPMPTKGPRTVVDHVLINWESAGHPPPHVYDVPHFDFHFYFVSQAERMKVTFNSDKDSADPAQQPQARLMPAGYILPPGTAVPQMGVHAINPAASEFHDQPFTATLIYGFYNGQQTFIEPMASLTYLRSKPSFSAPVPRPAAYSSSGAYPSTYSIRYDAARKVYEVMLEELS